MTESTHPPNNAGRRWLRRLLFLLLLLAAAWLLAGFALERSWKNATSDYQGTSLELRSHLPAPLPPGTVNGWDYLAAAELLIDGQSAVRHEVGKQERQPDAEYQALVLRFRQLDAAGQLPGEADQASFQKALERYALPLAVLDRGLAAAREARFETDYSVPATNIEIPNFLASLRIAGLLRARLALAAAAGDEAAAWRDAAGLYRLAYWNGTATNTLIGALIARATARQGDLAVQSLLGRSHPDAATRETVLAEARRLDVAPFFGRVFAAERAAMYEGLLDPRLTKKDFSFAADPENSGWESPAVLLYDWQPWRRFNAGRYLRWAGAADRLCAAPAYQQVEAPQKLAAAQIPGWISPAAALTFDCLESSQKRDLWQASRDFLEIAFALEAHREGSGAFPADLAALGPGVAAKIDPFSGKAYRYLPEGGGYRLYSVGGNAQDDGGRPVFKQDGQVDAAQGDWVWQVKAAPAAGLPR